MNDLLYTHCLDVLKIAHSAYVAMLVGKDARLEVANLVSAAKYLEALLNEFGVQEKIITKEELEKKDLDELYAKLARIVRVVHDKARATQTTQY